MNNYIAAALAIISSIASIPNAHGFGGIYNEVAFESGLPPEDAVSIDGIEGFYIPFFDDRLYLEISVTISPDPDNQNHYLVASSIDKRAPQQITQDTLLFRRPFHLPPKARIAFHRVGNQLFIDASRPEPQSWHVIYPIDSRQTENGLSFKIKTLSSALFVFDFDELNNKDSWFFSGSLLRKTGIKRGGFGFEGTPAMMKQVVHVLASSVKDPYMEKFPLHFFPEAALRGKSDRASLMPVRLAQIKQDEAVREAANRAAESRWQAAEKRRRLQERLGIKSPPAFFENGGRRRGGSSDEDNIKSIAGVVALGTGLLLAWDSIDSASPQETTNKPLEKKKCIRCGGNKFDPGTVEECRVCGGSGYAP